MDELNKISMMWRCELIFAIKQTNKQNISVEKLSTKWHKLQVTQSCPSCSTGWCFCSCRGKCLSDLCLSISSDAALTKCACPSDRKGRLPFSVKLYYIVCVSTSDQNSFPYRYWWGMWMGDYWVKQKYFFF